jgi:hypothetical protein
MSFTPMTDVPNPLFDLNGDPFSGAVLKAYLPGTTTAISIYTDAAGSSPQATLTANAQGAWEVTGSEVVPYIDQDHKWGIFANASDATSNTPFYMGPFDNIAAGGPSTSLNLAIIFTNYADLVSGTLPDGSSITLTAGQNARILGRVTEGDGGDNAYLIGTFGTADAGSIVDLDSGLQAKGLFPGGLFHVKQWGAASDTTDGTDGTDSLAAFQAAFDSEPDRLDVSGKYRLSNTAKFGSRIEIFGSGKIDGIYQVAVDAPVLASKAWYSGGGVGATGRVILRDFVVIGNASTADPLKTEQHGLVLHDFYSSIRNIRALNTGGDGIRLDALKDDGSPIVGTLVENTVDECDSYFAEGIGIHIGVATTATMTDGKISRCNILIGDTGLGGLRITQAAGWDISSIHTYNTAVEGPITILNCFYTNISNLYIERWTGTALAVSLQKTTNIENINIRSATTGTPPVSGDAAVTIIKTGAVSEADINISNVNIEMAVAVDIYGIEALSGNTSINLSNFNIEGDNADLYLGNNLSSTDTVISMAGLFDVSEQEISTTGLQGVTQAQCATSGLVSGNGAQNVILNIGRINSFRKLIGTLDIQARTSHNGGLDASYSAQIMVSAKDNTSNSWTAREIEISAPFGFTVDPTFTATITPGTDNGVLEVDFTFTDATAEGMVGFVFSPAQ